MPTYFGSYNNAPPFSYYVNTHRFDSYNSASPFGSDSNAHHFSPCNNTLLYISPQQC